MADSTEAARHQTKFYLAIVGYPIVVAGVALLINRYALPAAVQNALWPEQMLLLAFAFSTGLLWLNHCWIMTATELARLKHGIYVVPEEVPPAEQATYAPSPDGMADVGRCQNIHRNTTENSVYFFPLAIGLLLVPVLDKTEVGGAAFWFGAYALARLGYTFAYLRAKTGLRSLCMTVTLLANFGLLFQLIGALVS